MALNEKHQLVAQLSTLEKNGLADLDHVTIRQLGEMIVVDGGTERLEAKHIANPFGNLMANVYNLTSKEEKVADQELKQLRMLYLYLAAAPYWGRKITVSLHHFSEGSKDWMDARCRQALKNMKIRKENTGMEKNPGAVLQLALGGEVLALYYPNWKLFLPGTKFAKPEYQRIEGMEEATFLEAYPQIKERCRALLTSILLAGADPKIVEKLLEKLGGPLEESEMKKFRAEEEEPVPEEVQQYILTVSPEADPEAVCAGMGKQKGNKWLDTVTFLHTGEEALQNASSFGRLNDHLFAILPVQNTGSVRKVQYQFGPVIENEMPKWVEVTGELDGKLYHKIFAYPFSVCEPDVVLDLASKVPDGLLKKYNYLVENSEAESFEEEPRFVKWKWFPEDPQEVQAELSSRKSADGKWTIVQREKRMEKMELYEMELREGTLCRKCMLGSVFPEEVPQFCKNPGTVYVALDPAGSVSVRLISKDGSRAEALEYQDLVQPLTPVSQKQFHEMLERRTIPSNRAGSHFDALQQQFVPEDADNCSELMVCSRIWTPDEMLLFEGLKSAPGQKEQIFGALGVVTNMKESLTRNDLAGEEREKVVGAFKNYIGILLMEAVLSMARKGFSIAGKNLEFLISYPQNGSGEGITLQMKEIIEGAAALVNEYLQKEQQLIFERNVWIYAESEAAAAWNQMNQQDEMYLGNSVPTGTPDYGYSTHDFSLRVNGRLYLFSIPYAARKITDGTLAKVYRGHPEKLLSCFEGGTQKLKKEARETLEEAMHTKENPADRLGFTLTLSRLFAECHFSVTGVNSDRYQKKVQELTELKLNVGIPAYAAVIWHALKEQTLDPDQEIIFAPVGRGSLAFENTAPGFVERFKSRLFREIAYLMQQDPENSFDTEYDGNLEILENHDVQKESIARGLLEIRKKGKQGAEPVRTESRQLLEHYLNLAYGSKKEEETKEKFLSSYALCDKPGRRREQARMYQDLYRMAFEKLMKSYTYEKFEQAFERFGCTDIQKGIPQEEIGRLDEQIRELVESRFRNFVAEASQKYQDLIMSVPFVEEEMIAGAIIDLAVERIELFPGEKK